MEKYYVIGDCQVQVVFSDGLVQITNDLALKQVIQQYPEKSVDILIQHINEDYLTNQGKPLGITDNSFVVEIWGHVYFEFFLLKYKRLLRVIFAFGLYDSFRRSCEIIDCGEPGKDPNRRLWDRIATYRTRIAKWLPKVDLLRFAKQ